MVRCITCNVFHMRKFCRFFYCLAWSETVEFNRLPCSNNKIYDDADFADRFRYQLAMFEIRVLIWLSWLLYPHIVYITDGAKIIAAFCRISYCLHDLIRLNSTVGYVQTTRCTMIWFSVIDSDINWLCLKGVYSRGYLDSLILILHMKYLYKKSLLVTCLMRERSLMQDCSEKLFCTVIIDISMVVENVKILGIANKFDIYIYIIHLTYLYSYSITTLYHSVVIKNVVVFSIFDCL